MSQADETKTADELLFDIQTVGKYKITPLSFGRMALISPKLSKLVDTLAELKPDNTLDTKEIIKIALVILPDLLPIIALMVDAPESEIEALSGQDAVTLLIALWQANASMFLNFFQLASSLSPQAGAVQV